jgi:hypothetical protein
LLGVYGLWPFAVNRKRGKPQPVLHGAA